MESDLIGKKVRWIVSSAHGSYLAEATVVSVRETAFGLLAYMDNGSVANAEVLRAS